jgi:hypothetical protein
VHAPRWLQRFLDGYATSRRRRAHGGCTRLGWKYWQGAWRPFPTVHRVDQRCASTVPHTDQIAPEVAHELDSHEVFLDAENLQKPPSARRITSLIPEFLDNRASRHVERPIGPHATHGYMKTARNFGLLNNQLYPALEKSKQGPAGQAHVGALTPMEERQNKAAGREHLPVFRQNNRLPLSARGSRTTSLLGGSTKSHRHHQDMFIRGFSPRPVVDC